MYFIAHTIHRAYGQQITTDGSYSIFVIFFYFAGIEGFEPTTNRLTVYCSTTELYPQLKKLPKIIEVLVQHQMKTVDTFYNLCLIDQDTH